MAVFGAGGSRQDLNLPSFLANRVAEQKRIMGANGVQILADPGIALQALTHGQATFSHQDIARFLHTRTEGAAQFDAAYLKVTTSAELVRLGVDDAGLQRFTTRDMLETERQLLAHAESLSRRARHRVGRRAAPARQHLSAQQEQAFDHVTAEGDLATCRVWCVPRTRPISRLSKPARPHRPRPRLSAISESGAVEVCFTNRLGVIQTLFSESSFESETGDLLQNGTQGRR